MAYTKKLPAPPKYADEATWRGNSYDVGSRIVRAAWNMLFTKEPGEVSLRELAHEVGVSAPAAYNHFRDRDQLFGELAGGAMDMLTGHLLDLISDDAREMPKGLVPGICKVWLKFAEDRPRHYALMFSLEFNDSKRSARGAKRRNDLRLFLRSVVWKEVGFEVPGDEADLILAQLHGAAMLLATGDAKTPPKLLAIAMERQLAAIRKAGRSG